MFNFFIVLAAGGVAVTFFLTTLALLHRKIYHLRVRQTWIFARSSRVPEQQREPVSESENREPWTATPDTGTTKLQRIHSSDELYPESTSRRSAAVAAAAVSQSSQAVSQSSQATGMRRVPTEPEFSILKNLPGLSDHLASEWRRNRPQQPKASSRPLRILSLDGGGVRGILTAVILERLVEAFPNFLDNVDVIAGSSTGALIGLLLAKGFSPRQIKGIYKTNCPFIFHSTNWRRFNPWNAKYNDQWKKEGLEYYFGDSTLGQLGKYVVLTSFKLDGGLGEGNERRESFFPTNSWRPALLSNLPRAAGVVSPDTDLSCLDAVMRATAAPTFFPVYQGYCDGGVFQNNPAICGLTKVIAHFDNVTAENVTILSIGSGVYPKTVSSKKLGAGWRGNDWGLVHWAPHLLDLLLESSELGTELNLNFLLGPRFHRVNVAMPTAIELDDVNQMDLLMELAYSLDLTECHKWILENGFSDF